MPGWNSCKFCGAKYTYEYRTKALHYNYYINFRCRECGADYYYDMKGKLVVTKQPNK